MELRTYFRGRRYSTAKGLVRVGQQAVCIQAGVVTYHGPVFLADDKTYSVDWKHTTNDFPSSKSSNRQDEASNHKFYAFSENRPMIIIGV